MGLSSSLQLDVLFHTSSLTACHDHRLAWPHVAPLPTSHPASPYASEQRLACSSPHLPLVQHGPELGPLLLALLLPPAGEERHLSVHKGAVWARSGREVRGEEEWGCGSKCACLSQCAPPPPSPPSACCICNTERAPQRHAFRCQARTWVAPQCIEH